MSVLFWTPDRQRARARRENRSANPVNEMPARWQNAAAKIVLKVKQTADIPSRGLCGCR